jgi:predicted RNase H-related nuclease YkuK (DUF458 family)
MKRIKKLTAVLLAMAMTLSLTMFASAAASSATVTNNDGITDLAVTSFTSTDTALDGAVVTLMSDGSSDFAATPTIDKAGYTAAYASGTVTITKDSDSSTAGTLVITATAHGSTSGNGATITLSVPNSAGAANAGGGAPTATATVTNNDGITDLAVTSFTSTDTGLHGAVVTLMSDGSSDFAATPTIDKAGYTAAYASGTVTITKDSDSSTAGTLVITATAHGSTSGNGATITLSVVAGGGNSSVDSFDDAQGSGTGTGKKEGGDPDKVISLVLPTVSANAFDMILDPNELLKDTDYARLGGTTDVDFGSDAANHLFFNQGPDSSSGKTKYGKDSVELEIRNKSQIDVWVALDVEVDTGSSAVTFAADDTALAAVTDAAGMKLILSNTPVKGSNTTENTVWNATTNDKPTTQAVGSDGTASIAYKIPTIDVFKRTYDSTGKAYSYAIDSTKSQGADAEFNSTKFKLTGEINKDAAWDDVGASDISLTLTWKVSKDQPAGADPNAMPTVKESSKATATATTNLASATDAQKTVLTYTLGAGTNEMASVKSVKFLNAAGTNTLEWAFGANTNIAIDTATKTITIANVALINGGSNWKVVFVASDGTTTKEVAFTMHD